METLKNLLPEFAKDIKLNLSSMFTADDTSGLTREQTFGVALTSAFSTRNIELSKIAFADARNALSEDHLQACKTAATVMAMTNVYYRAIHFANVEKLAKLPPRLRMNSLSQHGIPRLDFELFSLAASAVNGCEKCVGAHVASAIKMGCSEEAIQSSFRIASVMAASAQALALSENR